MTIVPLTDVAGRSVQRSAVPVRELDVALNDEPSADNRLAAGVAWQEPDRAQLGSRRTDGERAAQVLREPDVEHLARALLEPGARRTHAARGRLQAASLSVLADDVRVPPQNGSGRSRADLAVPGAPHRSDENERPSGRVRVDERLGTREVEDRSASRCFVPFGVEEEDARVTGSALAGSGVVARTTRRPNVVPLAADRPQRRGDRARVSHARAAEESRARPPDTAGGDG